MKKTLLLLFLFANVTLICGQQNEHLTFLDVPINGSLKEFIPKMEAAGFVNPSEMDGVILMDGKFDNKYSMIQISINPTTNMVAEVSVFFTPKTPWNRLGREFFILKEKFRNKYGKPVDEIEMFYPPYEKGDGKEGKALEEGKCRYIYFWKISTGKICMLIDEKRFGIIYTDNINKPAEKNK